MLCIHCRDKERAHPCGLCACCYAERPTRERYLSQHQFQDNVAQIAAVACEPAQPDDPVTLAGPSGMVGLRGDPQGAPSGGDVEWQTPGVAIDPSDMIQFAPAPDNFSVASFPCNTWGQLGYDIGDLPMQISDHLKDSPWAAQQFTSTPKEENPLWAMWRQAAVLEQAKTSELPKATADDLIRRYNSGPVTEQKILDLLTALFLSGVEYGVSQALQ